MPYKIPPSRVIVALLITFAAVTAYNVSLYYPFISDDALISLRYSQRLLGGHGLTWTAGHPVEGYSNLLWVLLVAGLGLGGLDLVFAARLLGFLCTAAILGFLLFTGVRPGGPARVWFPATVGLLFVSLSAPVAVWTIGGLEQPLVGALLAASIPLMYSALTAEPAERAGRRPLIWLSVVLGMLALCRPDGPLFAAAATVTFLLAGPGTAFTRLVGGFVILSIPAVLYGGQFLFRYAYYGELLPNTALVKLTPTAVRRADGVQYLLSGLQSLSPFSFLAIAAMVGLLALPQYRRKAVYLLALSAIWSGYVVIIGGDIFPAYRHLVPLIVVFAFALIELFQVAAGFMPGRPWVTAIVVPLTLGLFIPFAQGQYAHKQSRRAVTERWEWECRDLGVFLKTAFSARQPVLAVTAAGCLPYWSELPSIDMLGLNDYYLPRHPPPDFGTGFLGHELGDGAYVLGRKPDIIVFSVGTKPSFRSGIEMSRMPEFHQRYVPVTARVDGMETFPLLFFYRDSPTLGIARSPSAITVPGFLFRSEQSVAYLSKNGRLVTAIAGSESVRLTVGAEHRSDWTIEVVGSQQELVTTHLEYGADVVTITLSANSPNPVEIESVILRPPPGRAPS